MKNFMNNKVKLPELYVATDVEADGSISGEYSMLSFGMALVTLVVSTNPILTSKTRQKRTTIC
ncbi:hypothetical protein SASC598O02_011180 [Snodgrassella alvi SCGC AB-598-O02]|nr:hypothetical protein SASC598O02_011180 [Snodgrassella alvi SCGC AB-598-O02]